MKFMGRSLEKESGNLSLPSLKEGIPLHEIPSMQMDPFKGA